MFPLASVKLEKTPAVLVLFLVVLSLISISDGYFTVVFTFFLGRRPTAVAAPALRAITEFQSAGCSFDWGAGYNLPRTCCFLFSFELIQ
ncbi:hypothetical protein B0H12DRAFT_221250 [Mycena haematopus]|nr:hypothetical protein B0H12DRAFT_221250 [Mycena haematopus]